jgi:hypothetical protein
MKKVTDGILEQQCKDKLRLQGAGKVHDSQDSVDE